MSDRERLAARLVEAVAGNILRRYESEYQADHLTWRDFAADARADLATTLRELAAKPDGYLRYQEDGGITYTKTLRGLADYIEKGAGDGQP